jgi:nucleoside phosphorylase
MDQLRSLKHEDYAVGWICALPLELIASKTMLDEIHARLPQDESDHNTYILGRIGTFNIAMACLPAGETGNNSSAIAGAQMKHTFKKVKIRLLVGIGGGAPSASHDIRLGDVVISKPGPQNGGVVQFDFGKTIEEGHFIRTGSLDRPPRALLTALSVLQAKHATEPSTIQLYLDEMLLKLTPSLRPKYSYQGLENDQLYQAQYDHVKGPTCTNCDTKKLVTRKPRESSAVVIHYGTIASANQVMRNGATRDQLAKEFGGLCFEMEAAGLMEDFRCIVIRGICDYADSHKDKKWQEYAAATAAAFAKEFLSVLPPRELSQISKIIDPN